MNWKFCICKNNLTKNAILQKKRKKKRNLGNNWYFNLGKLAKLYIMLQYASKKTLHSLSYQSATVIYLFIYFFNSNSVKTD